MALACRNETLESVAHVSSIESALCAGGTYYPVRVGLMSVQRIEDMKFERLSNSDIHNLNNNNVVCAQPSTIPVRTIPCGGACLADEGGAAGRPGAARPERQSQRLPVAAGRLRARSASGVRRPSWEAGTWRHPPTRSIGTAKIWSM